MKITFWGAARKVTGSMFQLTMDNGYTILVDCGSDFSDPFYSYSPVFPFEPSNINVVLLTHAHIDHSGSIPALIRNGFSGQVITTAPTAELSELLFEDNASIFRSRTKIKIDPAKEAALAADRFVPIAPNKKFALTESIHVEFIPVGHLLGACSIHITWKEKGTIKSILFSGDIGRKNYPLLQDPSIMPPSDYIVCETTYGNRLHSTDNQTEDFLEKVIKETCVDQAGRLIIPSFSLGRTQSLLYTLHKLSIAGRLPSIKVFTDSNLAAAGTRVYERFESWMNPEAKRLKLKGDSLFDFDQLIHIRNFKDSKAISNYNEPCIILSSSGMIAGGKIQHHIRQNIQNPYCTILLVGYAVEGTIGHDLLSGKKVIQFKRKKIPVDARIVYTDLYSGHADRNGLIEYISSIENSKSKKIFLVHGESHSMQDFQQTLQEMGYADVNMPERGMIYEL
jgi:metallo-beta-lactamase family protein